MALVPAAATTLAVTDYDQVRTEVGMPEVRTGSPQTAQFWSAAARLAVLTPGVLRPVDTLLQRDDGFGQADVSWEADFHGGGVSGWALRLRNGVPMAAVRRAVRAGVGPLRGARVDVRDHLVSRGAAAPGEPNWAGRRGLPGLVDGPALATYVQRGCVAGDTGDARLQPLTAYAVQYAATLATARLGAGRDDLFARMRLGRTRPRFARIFRRGAADPSSGRIGYQMTDPAAAATLALHHQLPFAVCAP